jgi:uncharacterized membrane protein YdjX (TVP38/TMEM64 family)
MAFRRNLQRHLVSIGLLIFLAGLFAASDTLHGKTEAIVVWTENLISQAPLLGMLAFLSLAMLSAMVAFFSSALLAPIAIYAWGKAGCLALLWCGWFLGGVASYCVGRYLGRSVAATIVGSDKIAAWENQVSEHTRFVHILFFQAIVPSEIPGYILGVLRYRMALYLVALGITELPYAIATVYLGDSFLKGEGRVFFLLGIGAIVLAAFVVQIHRRLSRQLSQNNGSNDRGHNGHDHDRREQALDDDVRR